MATSYNLNSDGDLYQIISNVEVAQKSKTASGTMLLMSFSHYQLYPCCYSVCSSASQSSSISSSFFHCFCCNQSSTTLFSPFPLFDTLLMPRFIPAVSLQMNWLADFFPECSRLIYSAQPAIISIFSSTARWVPKYNLCKKYHFVLCFVQTREWKRQKIFKGLAVLLRQS